MAHSKLCGSTVKIDLKMDGPVVTDFAHDVKACALGQASSSIMASHVVGSTANELRELRETVRKMLKENGSPPQGKWADIALLEPVRDYKARHASTMLTFDAVVDAIGQIEAKTNSRRTRRADSQGHATPNVLSPYCYLAGLPPTRRRSGPAPPPSWSISAAADGFLGLHRSARRSDPAPV